MTTPEEAVRVDADEERGQVLAMLCVNDDGNVHDYDIEEAERRITAYRDALLTAERARLAARVEGMREKHREEESRWDFYETLARNSVVDAVLALLREAA